MCCRVVLSEQDERSFRESIREQFDVIDDSQLQFTYSHNIAPGSILPVVYKDVVIKASSMKWGLIPFSGGSQFKNFFPNSRIETADVKVSFRDSFNKRRCLIPVTGYYEWKEEHGVKQPYYFYSRDGKMLALAGFYKRARVSKKQEPQYTFTILTQEARGDLVGIHDRMPVILKKELWEVWLGPELTSSQKEVIVRRSRIDIDFYKVSTEVNNVRNDAKRLIDKAVVS